MIYGIILSAGKQSRYDDFIPKALADFNGKPLLMYNIYNMKLVCDKVYTVCSYENEKYFIDYPHITIKSGLGCGDAVLKALKIINPTSKDMVFIQWGDSIQEMNLYIAMKKKLKSDIILPCVKNKKPYVQVKEENGKIKVLFSKYGEQTQKGYNDLGIFYGKAKKILFYLEKYAKSVTKWCEYNTIHNNELLFLDMFNYTGIKTDLLLFNNYKGFNFNTIQEFNKRKESF